MIRACFLLALATSAFGVSTGYPYGYAGGAPTAYGAYNTPVASLSSYGYGHGHGVPSYGYGLGSYGLSYGSGLGGLGYSTVLHKKCKYKFLDSREIAHISQKVLAYYRRQNL